MRGIILLEFEVVRKVSARPKGSFDVEIAQIRRFDDSCCGIFADLVSLRTKGDERSKLWIY